MPVHRTRPLHVGPAQGAIVVSEAIASETLSLLQTFRGDDGPHEGLLYWGGRRSDRDVIVTNVFLVPCVHTWGSVRVDERGAGLASRAARSAGVLIIAQVHSHPGGDTRHSDGDDDMILMPHEGYYSVVVANYGHVAALDDETTSIHQYRRGQWILVDPADQPLKPVRTHIHGA